MSWARVRARWVLGFSLSFFRLVNILSYINYIIIYCIVLYKEYNDLDFIFEGKLYNRESVGVLGSQPSLVWRQTGHLHAGEG